MKVIRGLHNIRSSHRGCVATIGNFDGVHLGHRCVFERLLARGHELGRPATVITFEPQPLEVLAPELAPARLTRLREKLDAIAACGVEQVVLLGFGPKLAALEPRTFVRDLLVDGLAAALLLVGDDFRFGRGRAGDIALLHRIGAEFGFVVEDLDTVMHERERISSTRIREALANGDLERARRLLGRPYRICGRVVHGDHRGRALGFPTANIGLHRRVSPLNGVYAVTVDGVANRPWPGVANIGVRPTLGGERRYLLEVHLFDFAGDIYGQHAEVEPRLKLRDEQRFESLDALKEQIARDAAAARAYLGLPASGPEPERHTP